MVYWDDMARKTQNRRYLILGKDVMRITGLKWTYIQYCIWRTGFRWDKTGKIKLGARRKGRMAPVRGKRYSPEAVWDVNAFLNYDSKKFRKLAMQNAWTRLRHNINEFDD
jgi:hypothetical protein